MKTWFDIVKEESKNPYYKTGTSVVGNYHGQSFKGIISMARMNTANHRLLEYTIQLAEPMKGNFSDRTSIIITDHSEEGFQAGNYFEPSKTTFKVGKAIKNMLYDDIQKNYDKLEKWFSNKNDRRYLEMKKDLDEEKLKIDKM